MKNIVIALISLTAGIGALSVNAQKKLNPIDAYETYAEAPREVAYVHLNKSTYIKGEMIGFTAYVFDKYTKEPSQLTTNLYCIISNSQGQTIKKKLIKVNQGVASNVFDIDSTLSDGIFTFKAYTNWMRNFDEQNHFEQTFKVINSEKVDLIKPVSNKDIKVDLQVLGEGGHILYDVPNNLGIIAKNQFGYGIANAYGSIVDNTGTVMTEFQLNEVGLAKALFTPAPDKTYTVNLELNNRTIKQPISGIKLNGLIMNLVPSPDKITLLLRTNSRSLENLADKSFKLGLHNGHKMITNSVSINNEGIAIISYPKNELLAGMNIFTVFDEKNNPILERLYFNKEGINQQKVSDVKFKTYNDSLDISLGIKTIDPSKFSNLSVSILPSDTRSYNHNNNILSQLYIQPYVKGSIQNGAQYFSNNSRETNYNLDLLLLTQGWSSYDWNLIFKSKSKAYNYSFERGIDIVANINNKKSGAYIVYPLAQNNTQLFDVPKNENAFTIKTSFPNEDDILRIGYLNTVKKEFKAKPSLYLQSYPAEIPDFDSNMSIVTENYTLNETYINPNQVNNARDNASKVTKLDEVFLEGKIDRETEIEKLKELATYKRYDYVKENIKLRGMRLDIYLQRLGYYTEFEYFSGLLIIENPRASGKDPVPLIYLNDALLTTQGKESDFSILTFITMDMVDYFEYEPYGIGGGLRGSAGYIKIYTTPGLPVNKKRDLTATFDLPLRFDKPKTFYTPKYQTFNSDFFLEYGTIAWQPNLTVDETGLADFKIIDTYTSSIDLYIEGIVNDNEYISQKITIEKAN